MPKQRLPENRGLPSRWRYTRGAYYYQVPPGLEKQWDGKKTYKLGNNLTDAYRKWAEKLEKNSDVSTINDLLDRYAIDVSPFKKGPSRYNDLRNIKQLRPVFGKMRLEDIQPSYVYRYVDMRKKEISAKGNSGATTAKLEVATLSHAYSKAVEWGYINKHPFKGEVTIQGAAPRTRYVEDWEIIETLSLTTPNRKGGVRLVQAYIKLKLLTSLRGADMLQLKETQLREDGIHIGTSKTNMPVIYEWSDELRAVVAEIKAARGIEISPYLICNKYGQGYWDEEKGQASGWHSMWQRFMARLLKETKITERFTEHDLRAKCASDAETLEHARALLTHTNTKTTQRIYRRKPEKVRPLR